MYLRLVSVALVALLMPRVTAAQEEVELNIRNQTATIMQVFALWETGTSVRLGNLNANQTRSFTTPMRGQEVTLAVQVQEQGGRAERVSSDNVQDIVAVRAGDRVEWEIRDTDPLDLYLRGVTSDVGTGDIESAEPRVSRYTAISALRIGEAMSAEGDSAKAAAFRVALATVYDGLSNETNNPEAYLHLGIIQTGLNNYLAADSAFDRAEAMYPAYVDEENGTGAYRLNGWLQAYNQATARMNAQDAEGAIELFNAANMIFDKRPEAYLNLGAQTANIGDLDASIEAWRSAAAVIESPDADPGDEATRQAWDEDYWPMALTNLGRVLEMAGRNEEAVPVYERILERYPDDAQARSSLAMALAATGQGGDALGVFDEILGRDDGTPLDYFNAGVSLYSVEQYEQAVVGFEKSLERAPMYRDALQNLVQTLNVMESYEAQLPHSERLLEIDPNNEYAYQMHIRALVQLGRQADGVAVLDVMRELPFLIDGLQLQPMTTGTRVAGQAVNKTLAPGTTITLRFTFYDNEGNPIGTEDTEVTISDPDVAHPFQVSFDSDGQVLGYSYEFVN